MAEYPRPPGRITDPIRRAALARDASPYLLTPAEVLVARSTADIAATMRSAARRGEHLTFRAGGTSLAGQASTDEFMVDVRRHFGDIEILDGGRRVRTGPGATLARVNAHLAPYGYRLGPDPASLIAATVGGCIANNSSGMRSGTALTAYWTIESMQVVLPSGTVIDTGHPEADQQLRRTEPDLYAGLVELRDRVRQPALRAEVRRQFALKNTMGYQLNAFLDADEPVQILQRLLVGSEGTLGFVAEATWRTIAIRPHAATALALFATVAEATRAIEPLVAAHANAVELLDATSLRVAGPSVTALLDVDHIEHQCALLIEFDAESEAELISTLPAAEDVLAGLGALTTTQLHRDPQQRATLWHIRSGLYAAIAAGRPPGTLAFIEDIAVPVAELADTVTELSALLTRHNFGDAAAIFGHAKDGNLHFMVTPRLDDPGAAAAHEAFTEELVELVLRHRGTLKAEHGTGRMMAPYVHRQYGAELYDVMRRIKDLFDPHHILAPGILITDDPSIATRGFKVTPQVNPIVDACVDCGYCESVCPSRSLTTTPRQRIGLLRAGFGPDDPGFDYGVVDTCAVDSLCALACPLGIDTGKAMKGLRAERMGPAGQTVGVGLAKAWGAVTPALRGAVTAIGSAGAVSRAIGRAATSTARAVLSPDLIPLIGPDFPPAGRRHPAPTAPEGATAGVLFASCLDQMFGPATPGTPGAARALLDLARKAGRPLAVPKLSGLCCGTVWSSKGLPEGRATMAKRVVTELWRATDSGRLPVISTESSCSLGLQSLGDVLHGETLAQFRALTIVDAVTFVARHLLPHLSTTKLPSVTIHPTCAATHLGTNSDLIAIAHALSDEVVVPVDAGCCGFAGDRGMLHPELTASATVPEARQVAETSTSAYASSNHTCELGMSRATGHTYLHIIELLHEQTTH